MLIAASLPDPDPYIYSTVFRPCSLLPLQQFQPFERIWSAFLEPLNQAPALDHESALPAISVANYCIINVERMCAAPRSIFFFSSLLVVLLPPDA